jgi:hypothetical protein
LRRPHVHLPETQLTDDSVIDVNIEEKRDCHRARPLK